MAYCGSHERLLNSADTSEPIGWRSLLNSSGRRSVKCGERLWSLMSLGVDAVVSQMRREAVESNV